MDENHLFTPITFPLSFISSFTDALVYGLIILHFLFSSVSSYLLLLFYFTLSKTTRGDLLFLGIVKHRYKKFLTLKKINLVKALF